MFLIEDGILQAYIGSSDIVVIPDGVTHIGGKSNDPEMKKMTPNFLGEDDYGYQAFYNNKNLKELYLPDSTVEIGFKSLEHCTSLEVLSFSNKMKTFGFNAINGCTSLKKIIYRGTIFEFSCLETPGQTPDLEIVYCTDGNIEFGKDREYYIETLVYPGTRAEWESNYPPTDWRNKRCRRIVCSDDYSKLLSWKHK